MMVIELIYLIKSVRAISRIVIVKNRTIYGFNEKLSIIGRICSRFTLTKAPRS